MYIIRDMAKFSLEEIETRDKLIHQGIFAAPQKPGGRAILWVHGLTGRFYGDAALMNLLADACGKAGMGFAAFNNRGHDVIAGFRRRDPSDPKGYVHDMIGGGREVFEECVHDIDAGISFLAGKGYTEIILAGHSTGANKVCYYAATVKDPRVAAVVLAGPISDRYSPHNDPAEYENNMTKLKMLRDDGKGSALLTNVTWMPATADRLWSLISPHTSEDVFNYGDGTDRLTLFARITVPTLVILSGKDENADRPVEEIRKAFDEKTKSVNYASIIIPDTTHGYEGSQDDFADTLISWATRLP